jgi:ribosome biogenesis GTPase
MERNAEAGRVSPGRRRRQLDEDDVRIRPGRGTRPRSVHRPKHADAEDAVVTTVDRGRYTCRTEANDRPRDVVAVKSRELGRKGVVVGDRVALVGDTSGEPGTLARIVRVAPRRSVLRRTADDTDPVERVIVANADQMCIVTAVADPEPRTRLIDRCLVAAYDAGLEPLLLVTKIDLGSPAALLDRYRPLGVHSIAVDKASDLADVRSALTGKVTVLVGHSGVGKSTMVNRLVPGSARAVGSVNEVTGRGRHTSSSAIALELPEGGWVVDTPGLRSFGLAHVSPDGVLRAFPDLAAAAEACPRGCTHAADTPDCALDEAVAQGAIRAERLDSLRRLLASRAGPEDEQAARAEPGANPRD